MRVSRIQLSDRFHREAHDVEPIARSCRSGFKYLRLATQPVRTGSAPVGVCRPMANHPGIPVFASAPEVRVLSSAGITRPQRSYDPVRLPPGPPPRAVLKSLPPTWTGLPRLPASPSQRAASITPADPTGACVDCFPVGAAFPILVVGRRPH